MIGTGLDIVRPWYEDTTYRDMDAGSQKKNLSQEAYPPRVLLSEPGAVLCRVSPSFVRVAQLELFARRSELIELKLLADHLCFREFPHLLPLQGAVRYIAMFKEIVKGE